MPSSYRAIPMLAAVLAAACSAPPAPVDDAGAALSAEAMDSALAGVSSDSTRAPQVLPAADTAATGGATLADIGYETGITLTGAVDAATVTIPVNRGQRPTRLVLAVDPTPRMPDATIVLRQGERVLAQRLLTDTTHQVVLPLDQAIVADGRAVVALGVNVPGRDACEAPLFYRTVFTPAGTVEYAGTVLPSTGVSSFFQPLLRRITFYLPPEPSLDASQAALEAAAFVARTYRGMGTRFAIGRLPSSDSAIAEPPSDERAILWANDGPTRVLGPDGGRGTVLAIASRRDAHQLFALPSGPSLVPARAFAATTARLADRAVGNVTFDALGIGSTTMQGSTIATAGFRFALADLGGVATPRAFRLVALHSSLPKDATGELAIMLNGSLIASRPLEGNAIDATFALPAHLVGRDNRIEVRFTLRLGEGECRLGAPLFTVTIDGGSALVTEARLAVPPSFDRFPAALLPTFSVLLEPRDRYRVELAATLIGAMQRTTVVPLVPFVVRDSNEVRGALLAVGTGTLAAALDAPVSSDGFRLRDIDGQVWDEYRPSESYGAMQAFRSHGRDVLLLHHTGADGQPLADLLREALAPYGWFGVHGDLALRGPDGPTTVMTAANAGWRLEPLGGEAASPLARWRSAIFIGAAILLLALLIWLYPRVVRRELDTTG